MMVGKEQKRCAGPEFLALEQNGRSWSEQQQGGHRPVASRMRQLMDSLAADRVRNLVVVFNECHECPRRKITRGRAAMLFLPPTPLPLVEVPVFASGHEFFRAAEIVGVIRLIVSRQRHYSGMMEVVVPQTVHAIAALVR